MTNNIENENLYWEGVTPEEIVKQFGSPIYVYSERILRERCVELKNFVTYEKFIVDYSMKANSNPALLKIVREEGLEVDAMSPGEIYIAQMAGYKPEEIFFVCNNVSPEEMMFAVDKGIKISVDSLSQLEQYGKLVPHGKVCLRVNPGIGAGHHEKVVTAGKQTKFGINADCVEEIKQILERYDLTLIGINQHIGSLFMKTEDYLKSVDALFEFALKFPDLQFVDLGGGFGVPYKAADGEGRLNLQELGRELDRLFAGFVQRYGRELFFRVEPGRYVAAECGRILGTVNGVKYNGEKKYIGADIGFNVLMRPVLYDSYHELAFYRDGLLLDHTSGEPAAVVGNICESGDILAGERMLPIVSPGDTMVVKDAGAYGHVMSSNYNGRLRTGEVLITMDGEVKEIRKRDSFEDLVKNYIF